MDDPTVAPYFISKAPLYSSLFILPAIKEDIGTVDPPDEPVH